MPGQAAHFLIDLVADCNNLGENTRPMSRSKQELASEFAARLGLITDIYTQALRKILRQTKIRQDRLKVLMFVRSQPSSEMTFMDLGMKMKLEKHQVTRIADWLEKNGLASVHVNPKDKRSRIIKASPDGVSSSDEIAQKVVTEIMGSKLEKAKIEQLCKNMEAVLGYVQGWEYRLFPDFAALADRRSWASTARDFKKG